ncbi:hypothetical protein [Noviherbaspirillum pedocola]|uniref:Uncharacterized protein n=1 Tax=Noviherbaspirillum pedocola TaxID=2801341 RepID=A0A934STH4_9BURK|nr:hypothetical protein [Noviherbaspirillum pedocola]MBK4735214.1 hypothetical protein [Noviherbaspirillum pedocola]
MGLNIGRGANRHRSDAVRPILFCMSAARSSIVKRSDSTYGVSSSGPAEDCPVIGALMVMSAARDAEIATRYDKTVQNFLGAIHLATTVIQRN